MMSQFVYSSSGVVGTVRTQQFDELHQSASLKNELCVLDSLKTHPNYKVCIPFLFFFLWLSTFPSKIS